MRTERTSTEREYERITALVREYIDDNYDDSSLSLDDFCRAERYTRRSTQRALTYTGNTWRELLRAKRLSVACRLLAETELAIGIVARRAGYSHSSHMGRAFIEERQITPAEYRSQHRHRGDDVNGAG